jgi:hypothetical protein
MVPKILCHLGLWISFFNLTGHGFDVYMTYYEHVPAFSSCTYPDVSVGDDSGFPVSQTLPAMLLYISIVAKMNYSSFYVHHLMISEFLPQNGSPKEGVPYSSACLLRSFFF